MKLTEINLKAIFVITMLLLNIFVSASDKIQLHKTLSKYEKRLHAHNSKTASSSKKTSSSNKNQFSTRAASKTKLSLSGKLEALLVGFTTEGVSEALKIKKDGVLINKVRSAVVDYCFEPAVAEFEAVKQEYLKKKQKEVPCKAEIIDELLGGLSGDSIQSECAMLSTIRELDDNKFSTLNVIGSKFEGLFQKNNEWEQEYQFFKTKKTELENTVKDMTDGYIATFKVYEKGDDIPQAKKKTAKRLLSVMDGLFEKKDICKALDECNVLGVIDYIKILLTTSIGFLKCVPGSLSKALANYSIDYLIRQIGSILASLGVSAVTSVAKMVFPGLLAPIIIKFIIHKFKLLQKISSSFFKMASESSEHLNEEKELWNMLGELLFDILWAVVGRRRKLKKLKK